MAGSDIFARPSDADWTPTEPGVKRRILTWNEQLMVVEVAFEKGAVGSIHNHPHIQASYVAKGSFDVTIAGRTERLSKGQSFIVPSDEPHGVVALEAAVLIDTFAPMRKEFVGLA